MGGKLGKLGKLQKRGGIGTLKPLPTDFGAELDKSEEQRGKDWAARVGADRAELARRVLEARPAHQRGKSRASLPNLLAEAWAQTTGRRYVIEFDLGWARPDLVIFLDAGVVIIRVQGDYWHSLPGRPEKDAVQMEELRQTTVEGMRVLGVVDVWEKEIYEGTAALERALLVNP